jgi:PAS domain-containing protein
VGDLFPPDSEGIQTFDQLLRASPHTPILVSSHLAQRVCCEAGRATRSTRPSASRTARWSFIAEGVEQHARAFGVLERERALVTLDSIGDAVISIDVAGNIVYLNAVAESMTGWSRQEASGRPQQEVLRMIDGDSPEPALNPLAMAILHNESVGLSAKPSSHPPRRL